VRCRLFEIPQESVAVVRPLWPGASTWGFSTDLLAGIHGRADGKGIGGQRVSEFHAGSDAQLGEHLA
jgi:hypothetical protein